MKDQLLNKVENIVTKEEIACFEQFLLLSQCFQKWSAAEAAESAYMWKRDSTCFKFFDNIVSISHLLDGK